MKPILSAEIANKPVTETRRAAPLVVYGHGEICVNNPFWCGSCIKRGTSVHHGNRCSSSWAGGMTVTAWRLRGRGGMRIVSSQFCLARAWRPWQRMAEASIYKGVFHRRRLGAPYHRNERQQGWPQNSTAVVVAWGTQSEHVLHQ